MSGLKKEESFTVDGVAIAAPSTYKPVFATTSTKSSKRDQELSMHNSPMGTIGGYDLTWDVLSWEEIAVILNGMINIRILQSQVNGLTGRSMRRTTI